MQDWTGTAQFIKSGNNRKDDAEQHDYYATDPKAVEILLENEKFHPYIWEPACGEGHISKVLKEHGYKVRSSDIIDRGYEGTEILDFLKTKSSRDDYDIVTKPPYRYAKEFVEKAIEILPMDGAKVAMFLKLTFLEGQARRELFKQYPPKTVYVFSGRVECAKNGEFTGGSAVAYAWFIWEIGYKGKSIIKWVN